MKVQKTPDFTVRTEIKTSIVGYLIAHWAPVLPIISIIEAILDVQKKNFTTRRNIVTF